ncbi:hypothetical protein HMPREF9374_0618 [Desmospora sp. 8437]|nr:hypothetical protein HMPREF9374_0618 [Desmospora sp. 8437]
MHSCRAGITNNITVHPLPLFDKQKIVQNEWRVNRESGSQPKRGDDFRSGLQSKLICGYKDTKKPGPLPGYELFPVGEPELCHRGQSLKSPFKFAAPRSSSTQAPIVHRRHHCDRGSRFCLRDDRRLGSSNKQLMKRAGTLEAQIKSNQDLCLVIKTFLPPEPLVGSRPQ